MNSNASTKKILEARPAETYKANNFIFLAIIKLIFYQIYTWKYEWKLWKFLAKNNIYVWILKFLIHSFSAISPRIHAQSTTNCSWYYGAYAALQHDIALFAYYNSSPLNAVDAVPLAFLLFLWLLLNSIYYIKETFPLIKILKLEIYSYS